jgi:dipeptidyl aminopeptidase/acylaminoacyl peptidase
MHVPKGEESMKRILWAAAMIALPFALLHAIEADEGERREEGNLVIEGIPEIPARVEERMLQYQNTRSAVLHDWDPSGEGILISTRFGETSQIHQVKQPGGARHQITFFPDAVSDAAMCPDSSQRMFLFMKDVGGSEFYQIFSFDMANGKYELLTDGSSMNGDILWSRRGDRFVYYSTRRNGTDYDLYLASLEKPNEASLILQEGGTWNPVDWSPDDTRLLVSKYVSINETYPHILDLSSGKLTRIHPTDRVIAYGDAAWDRSGDGIFITSDEGSEFKRLRYYDFEKKKFSDITAGIPWDVESVEMSPQGDRLAFTTNEGGVNALYLLDPERKSYKAVPGVPQGLIYGLEFSPDGTRLGFVINTAQTPGDVYVLDTADRSLERWTFSEVGGLDTDSFTAPELIEYETFDSVEGKPRTIPAFYFKPRGEGPFPVIVYAHGGPESQYSPYFSSTFQYWVNELGIAILAPNVRGSSGYGKSFLLLDNGMKREDSVKDIGKLLDWIAGRPELDSRRVAIYGGSYGGYMVLASMIHYPERFTCGVDIVGISSFVTFLENTQDYRRDLRRAEYGDERDPEMRKYLQKISPLGNATAIRKPLFIIQGQNDPRVPVSESEQILEALQTNGGDAWYLLAKDEGHGFVKKSNRDYSTNATVLFLEKYLLQDSREGEVSVKEEL